MFFKIGFLENFAIFTGKHLRWNVFLIKSTYFEKYLRTAASETFSSKTYKDKSSLSNVFLIVFFSFRNYRGKDMRNKSLHIPSSIFLTSFCYSFHKLLCFAEKNKALPWKLKIWCRFFGLLCISFDSVVDRKKLREHSF